MSSKPHHLAVFAHFDTISERQTWLMQLTSQKPSHVFSYSYDKESTYRDMLIEAGELIRRYRREMPLGLRPAAITEKADHLIAELEEAGL